VGGSKLVPAGRQLVGNQYIVSHPCPLPSTLGAIVTTLRPPHRVQRNKRRTFEKGASASSRLMSGATAMGAE
jgi:hypothetical protein